MRRWSRLLRPGCSWSCWEQCVDRRGGDQLELTLQLPEFFQESSCRSGQLPPVTRPEHTMHSNENWGEQK